MPNTLPGNQRELLSACPKKKQLSSIGDKMKLLAKAESGMANWHNNCYYSGEQGNDFMKNGLMKHASVCLSILFFLGCNSVTGPDHNPTIRTVTTYQGAWEGTTSEGFSVKFTVTGNTVMSFLIDMFRSVPNKPAEKMTYFSNSTETIAGSYFSIRVYLDPSTDQSIAVGIPISGHFGSATAADGTSSPISGSAVTWTADKK
jgi:hypothetical protein